MFKTRRIGFGVLEFFRFWIYLAVRLFRSAGPLSRFGFRVLVQWRKEFS